MESPNPAIEKVFKTRLIFGEILKQETDVKELAKWRLVSKLFNSECLYSIRKSHKTITIEPSPNEPDQILVNNGSFRVSEYPNMNKFLQYARFLKTVVGVKVVRLELKKMYEFDENYHLHKAIHEIIHKELIGEDAASLTDFIRMWNICPDGCSACTILAQKCQKYGPIQWRAFFSQFPTRHFKELIISDGFLYALADQLDEGSQLEEFLANFRLRIPRITCDHLVLSITEPKYERYSRRPPEGPQGIPREILHEILKSWRPKSIGIQIQPFGILEENGYLNRYFERFRFDAPRNSKTEHFQFENVKLNLSNSLTYSNECGNYSKEKGQFFMKNVRRLFPTNQISMIFPKNFMEFSRIMHGIRSILEGILTENPENLKMDVDVFPEIPPNRVIGQHMNAMLIQENWFKIHLETEQYEMGKYIGKRLTVKCAERNLQMNVRIWMEKDKFREYFHTLRGVPYCNNTLWLIKAFVSPSHSNSCDICQEIFRIIPIPGVFVGNRCCARPLS